MGSLTFPFNSPFRPLVFLSAQCWKLAARDAPLLVGVVGSGRSGEHGADWPRGANGVE